ncbi:MAG TPA: spermidine synthase [Phenylobacterium sp.]
MIPWVRVDTAATPGGGELRLMQRGFEFSITIDGAELMNSRRGGSEVALAELACERLRDRTAAAVLIGGLGMGFTLRATLAALGPKAEVTVAELVPAVVGWARGPLAEVFGGILDDPRTRIVEADVRTLIDGQDVYDAILLDVDNGPDDLVQPDNAGLYTEAGLAAARRALRPGGVMAIWSASGDDAFVRRLRRAGYAVEEKMARSGGKKGARHIVWLATPR